MDKQYVREIALDNGFKLKQQPDGDMDLNPYVYQFADELCSLLVLRSAELEQERDQLKAQNTELTHYLYLIATQGIHALPGTGTQEWMKKKAQEAVDKSPAACLADIQAKAIDDMLNTVESFNGDFGLCSHRSDMYSYVKNLRQQSTILE